MLKAKGNQKNDVWKKIENISKEMEIIKRNKFWGLNFKISLKGKP